MSWFRVAVAALLCGCVVNVEYDDGSFLCAQDVCPERYVCRNERCVPEDAPVPPGNFRRRLEIGYQGAEPLPKFPLLVSLDSTTIDYQTAGESGESLRFTTLDDTLLAHEIETWDASGTSQVWVAVSLVPGDPDDAIYMYWGSSDPPLAPPPTAVWDDDFVAVWHLDDDPASGAALAVLDSTSNRHHGTASDSMNIDSLEIGPLGIATYIDDADDAIIIGDKPEFELPTYTFTFWIRGDSAPDNVSGNGQPIFNADQQFNFSWNHSQPAFAQAAVHNDADGPSPAQIAEPLEADVWYSIAVSYDGTMLRIHLDGLESGAIAQGSPVTTSGPLALGNDPALVRFAGALDEVRISRSARSAAWIKAVYDSTSLALVSFGPPEAL